MYRAYRGHCDSLTHSLTHSRHRQQFNHSTITTVPGSRSASSSSRATAAALSALFLRPLAPDVVVKMKTPQPVALLLGMPSRRRPAACMDGRAARAPAHPLASTVLRPAKMLHRHKPVGRLPLTITRSFSPSRTPTAITTPRPPAYTKPTRTAPTRAATTPSARRLSTSASTASAS